MVNIHTFTVDLWPLALSSTKCKKLLQTDMPVSTHFAFDLSIAQTGNWFYSVNKLKKTNISHLLNLDFKNVPT
jgi:hypothetical protein